MKSVDNVLVPQYNKSLRGGRGDREAESQWINATGKNIRKEKKNCIMRKKVSYDDSSETDESMTKEKKKSSKCTQKR